MKVLAINSSPRMDKGNTACILNPFLEGAKEAGGEIDLFYTIELNVNPCKGEFSCWTKTPGECYQKDDMQALYPKLRAADVIIIASPLYIYGVTGPTKNLIDRILPLFTPTITIEDNHSTHNLREGFKPSKFVLISTCGFWEMDNFDLLLDYVKKFVLSAGMEFAGALLRPHGGGLSYMKRQGVPIDDIFEAAKKAGYQIVENGNIADELIKTVGRELMPRKMYNEQVNKSFKRAMNSQ